MGLSDFIAVNQEAILAECKAFARNSLPAAAALDSEVLRDHAEQILTVIARNMKLSQMSVEQSSMVKEPSPELGNLGQTPAEQHGAVRAMAGFDINQTVAEYRALRASVMRLWLLTSPELGPLEVDEVIRFNAGMDQALAESVLEFAKVTVENRNLFLGVLSHELRTPLGTIVASAHSQLKAAQQGRVLADAMHRVLRGSKRIESLLNDLLDYVRSGMGGGVRVTPIEMRLDELCEKIVQEMRSSHPGRDIQLLSRGNTTGLWDEQRLAQAISNLLGNALKYGASEKPVQVTVDGCSDQTIGIAVRNFGFPIGEEMRQSLFEPLIRGAGPDKSGVSLGLGLYIVRAIAVAHGGCVDVRSTGPEGTEFYISLPRWSEAFEPSAFASLRM